MSDRDITFFQRRSKEDEKCTSSDPISLDMTGLDTEVFSKTLEEAAADSNGESPSKNRRTHYATFARIVEVRCYQESSASCTGDEQTLDDLRKRIETLEATP